MGTMTIPAAPPVSSGVTWRLLPRPYSLTSSMVTLTGWEGEIACLCEGPYHVAQYES